MLGNLVARVCCAVVGRTDSGLIMQPSLTMVLVAFIYPVLARAEVAQRIEQEAGPAVESGSRFND